MHLTQALTQIVSYDFKERCKLTKKVASNAFLENLVLFDLKTPNSQKKGLRGFRVCYKFT